jgi:hypothetical protein
MIRGVGGLSRNAAQSDCRWLSFRSPLRVFRLVLAPRWPSPPLRLGHPLRWPAPAPTPATSDPFQHDDRLVDPFPFFAEVGQHFVDVHLRRLTRRKKRSDVDLENLVIRVELGKGRKARLVPISLELRKRLWRYLSKLPEEGSVYVFATKRGTKVTLRNFGYDLKLLGDKLHITGVRFSPHTLRHTFAVNYLRAGGNVFYLQRILAARV